MLLFVVIIILFYENMITTNKKISYFSYNFNRKSTYCSKVSLQHEVLRPKIIESEFQQEFLKLISISLLVSPQSRPVPRRSHCPSPTSIPNGYYVTDTDAGTPLALPVSKQGQYERGTIARYHCQEGYIMRYVLLLLYNYTSTIHLIRSNFVIKCIKSLFLFLLSKSSYSVFT